jgi:hypothetical protein
LESTPETNERSILSTSIGNDFSRLSDEYPVPKSSSASMRPCSCIVLRIVAGEAASSISTLSVISSPSVPGRSPLRSAMLAACAGNRGFVACRPETLTDTPSDVPNCCCQAAVWRQACSRT